jgi:SpoVK/Ycf46/Vps4 family AAA+-type ATPase
VLAVPTGPVGILDRRRAWRESLPDLGEHAPELAARHPLDPVLTAQVAADVRSSQRLAGGLHGLPEVCGVIRSRAAVALPSGTRLVTPAASWERLVLGEQPARQLRDAVDRLDRQAQVLDEWRFEEQARADRGVRLLFAGPPGTGKSLAAEVVAASAEADLLVVDVSRIVSKWVGETEKNLAEVFDAAERTRAVLLLDEADALFAARTEISDAHDRYANVETAYLLQRLDRFDGLAVLATNFLQNVDPAFLRRMHFVVRFEPPDELERERMWALHLPRHAPLGDDIDLAVLARLYPIPGAWIRNAAVGAAFLAAGEGTTVAQRHLTWAVRREYEKTARPYPGDPIASRRPLRDGGTKETA